MKRKQHRAAEVNGVAMRSTLEARWATFFSQLGLKWRYEPEVFDLPNGGYYTPDFHVEGLGWIEIKPTLAHLHESWQRLRPFLRLHPQMVVYLFPGEKVYFRDVVRFQNSLVYRPTTRQMFTTLALIRHGETALDYELISAAINAAMDSANNCEISHAISWRDHFVFNWREIVLPL